jgi:aminocarboxymuconate-semialdehyde decarboxylase
VFQAENVAHLIRVMGASQVVLGTDYPFDMGQENPVELIESIDGLSDDDAKRITGGNAAALLRLS